MKPKDKTLHDRIRRLTAHLAHGISAGGKLGAAAVAISLCSGGIAAAQDVQGVPPTPDEEHPQPLPVKADPVPQIPAEFNRPVADYHVVRQGDTLFDLSRSYFSNPYLWPVVWSFNAHITNPHWIYPGDVVYLRAPLPGDAPHDAASEGVKPIGGPDAGDGLSVALAGFWSNRNLGDGKGKDKDSKASGSGESLHAVGKIVYSPENKAMLSFPDKVYVSLNDSEDQRVKEGSVYGILRQVGEVRDPDDDDLVIATKFKVIGAIRIVEPNPDYLHSGVIVQSWEEIRRGDILYPYERQLLRVAPAVATKTDVGIIVDTIAVKNLIAEQDYVLINRGDKDGVRVGNRFFAYMRQDGLSELDDDDLTKLPFERVAQMRVIHVEDNYSTALVTRSRRELERGWRVEMYEGY